MLKTILPKKLFPGFALGVLFALLFVKGASGQSQSSGILTKKQNEFANWKYGIFLHFNMATYVNKEWATGYEDPLLFAPEKLDCGQWASVAKSAGMRYGVLTVKHTCGWCLWDSKYTTHDISIFKNYKNGQGDIVREFVDAFRKKGLKVGLYYCMPGDYSNGYGNVPAAGQKDLHGLPSEAGDDYEGFIEKQITELLTNYGPIDLLWFDQYSNKYTFKYWLQLKGLIHKLQPNCIVLANNSDNYQVSDVISYEYPYRKKATPDKALPPAGNKNVGEVCDCIDANGIWFWHTGPVTLQEPGVISGMIKLCNARNTNYLLDVPPNRDGLIGQEYIKRLAEIKAAISGK
ncbi:MAG: alpha-L-fucosidase [Mucilaginibacter sp.]